MVDAGSGGSENIASCATTVIAGRGPDFAAAICSDIAAAASHISVACLHPSSYSCSRHCAACRDCSPPGLCSAVYALRPTSCDNPCLGHHFEYLFPVRQTVAPADEPHKLRPVLAHGADGDKAADTDIADIVTGASATVAAIFAKIQSTALRTATVNAIISTAIMGSPIHVSFSDAITP